MGALLILLCGLTNVVAFVGFRLIATGGVKGGGLRLALGSVHEPWASTTLGRRLLFAASGPVGCYLAACLFFTIGFMADGERSSDEESARLTVLPEAPAALAGLEDGDVVTRVRDVPIRTFADVRREVSKPPDGPIPISVQRGGVERTFIATRDAAGKIGVIPFTERRTLPFGAAVAKSIIAPAQVWAAVVKAVERRKASAEDLAGPVAIVRETNRAEKEKNGWRFVAALNAYFLWIPILLAAGMFPRRGARSRR